MITIISPAKTLNFEKHIKTSLYSEPLFMEEVVELIGELKKYSPPELAKLMKISDKLSVLNVDRYIKWEQEHNLKNSRQSVLTFSGNVYRGLRADEFNDGQLKFCQKHLRILSGLYGTLRPLDLIQPYRLEMGIKLKNPKGKDLYEYWRDKLTSYFNEELSFHDNPILINLASKEYSSVLDINNFKGKIIDIVFKEYKNGTYKIISTNAKKARGLMTRYIIENKIDSLELLKEFNEDGYNYREELSTESLILFTRNM